MVKKQKVGKQRRDKFYNLAKESGYRSRASFKLLQLNRKFNFLQNSKICIDLCAAPGGWLQVAQQHMPQSSVIIGVDLVPIKPIPNVITFTSDITTEPCRNRLKKEMKDWKADVVLHDGAPNVGANWLHDAYSQSTLTLEAFKLACEMLKKGGWFITKVFRSSDYNALMWIFQQLFEKVHGTKPAASRNESAEIFVVCQNFKAPDKIDKKFFDIRSVFESVGEEGEKENKQIYLKDFAAGKKKKADGYDEGVGVSMYTKKTITEFLACSNPLTFIANCNELIFDQPFYKEHELTTVDIIESCKDLKLLNPTDAKALKKWYNKMSKELHKETEKLEKESNLKIQEINSDSDVEMKEIDEKLLEIKATEVSELKRKKKLKVRALKKLKRAIADTAASSSLGVATGEDDELFSLNRVKKAQNATPDEKAYFSDDEESLIFSSDESDNEKGLESGEEDEILERKRNERKRKRETKGEEIINHLESKKSRLKKQTNMWFTKPIFKGFDDEDGMDITNLELDLAAKKYKLEKETKTEEKIEEKKDETQDSGAISEEEEETSDYSSSDDEIQRNAAAFATRGPGWEFVDSKNKEQRMPTKENGGLTPQELAVATECALSKKKKREYIENSYNRYTFDDDANALPDWFLDDEKIHQRPDSGPSVQGSKNKEMVEFYKNREKGANVRTIKKVAEAKARKKKKILKRRERARKTADGILAQSDVSEKEKSAMVKQIYSKAGLSMSGGKQKDKRPAKPTIIRAKKGTGKRVRRPNGVKGTFKVVDKRMKNDIRHKKHRDKETKSKNGKVKKRR